MKADRNGPIRASGEEMGRRATRATRGAWTRFAAALAIAGLATCGAADARRAHVAHTLRASDRASLRYRSAKGSTLYETGRAFGSLPGGMRVHMQVSAVFTGTFTIYASGGTITGSGRAIPHGEGTIESFKGELTVTSGSGRYRHASGHAQLYGTFNRRTYALTIQTAGTLRY